MFFLEYKNKCQEYLCYSEVFSNSINYTCKNCVAIAIPVDKNLRDDNNCYLSISGYSHDYNGKIKYPNLKLKQETKKIYCEINKLLSKKFGFKFIECHLTEKTMRYTYLKHDKICQQHTKVTCGIFLQKPVKLKIDLKKNRKDLNRFYSCCEKKIISYMNFINMDKNKLIANKKVVNLLTSYEFIIKYEPCDACRPALIGCYNISYFQKNDRFSKYNMIGKSNNIKSCEPFILKKFF